MQEHYDAVVIGSGFGGSISALRLAEAGKSVVVLERGRRYPPETFPRDVTEVDKLFWRHSSRRASRGLFELRTFSGIGALVASGVGGGSLIYANIHIRPDPVVFDDPRWPSGFDRDHLDPYFDRVARMLGVAPLPESVVLPKRDAFRAAGRVLGKTVFDPDQAVAWTEDPGEGRSACQLCAECQFGCRNGSKNTLDFTYLAGAERLGTHVLTGANVSHIEPDGRGYRVHYEDTESGERSTVTGSRVVVCAGTLGTNEILLRSRDQAHTLPGLSRMLGHGYSGNGDFLGTIQSCREDLVPWHGPDVTSVMRFFDTEPRFTLAAPGFNRPVMEVLASMGQARPEWMRPMRPLFWPKLERVLPRLFQKGLLSRPSPLPSPHSGHPAHMTTLFAIGQDNANGRIVLGTKRLDIEWDFAGENRALIARMTAAMREVGAAYGGTAAPLATWEAFRRILTVHSLGGCRLADSPDQGVVSTEGEVFGHPGLFVADGSVIPAAIGFHPAMTISAVAERIADSVVASF